MFFTLAGFLLTSQLYVEEPIVPDGFKIEPFASNVINAQALRLSAMRSAMTCTASISVQ